MQARVSEGEFQGRQGLWESLPRASLMRQSDALVRLGYGICCSPCRRPVCHLGRFHLHEQRQCVVDAPFIDDHAVPVVVMAYSHDLYALASGLAKCLQQAIAQVVAVENPANGELCTAFLTGSGADMLQREGGIGQRSDQAERLVYK